MRCVEGRGAGAEGGGALRREIDSAAPSESRVLLARVGGGACLLGVRSAAAADTKKNLKRFKIFFSVMKWTLKVVFSGVRGRARKMSWCPPFSYYLPCETMGVYSGI